MKDLKHQQTAAYFVAFMALGIALASLGPTLPGLAGQVRVSMADISYLFTLRSFGFLIGSLLSGSLYDRMSGHRVMSAMVVSMSATLALMPIAGTLVVLLFVMFLLGTAEGALGVGGNALLVWVHQRRVAPFMNALHFCYGVGAFISPLIIHFVARRFGDTTTAEYLALAILVLPSAIWLLALPSPRNPGALSEADNGEKETPLDDEVFVKGQEPGYIAVVHYKAVVLVAILLCLYLGAEVSYGNWIYSYVLKMNLGGDDMAAYLTSAFWGSLTIGRLLGVPLAAKFRPGKLLLADLISCFAFLGIALLWSKSPTAITVASIGAGLSMASIYPMALSLAERRSRITGQVTGFLLLGGSVGGMILPFLIGQMFDKGPRVMMIIILFDLIAALAVYLILATSSTTEYEPGPALQQES